MVLAAEVKSELEEELELDEIVDTGSGEGNKTPIYKRSSITL